MRAYSIDLRERLARAVASGQPLATTARRFEVSVKTVQRLVRLQDATGSLAPRPRPGMARRIGVADEERLRERLEAAPDATVLENCAWWVEVRGQQVSEATMWRAMRRLGWTHKKNSHSKRAG